MNSFLLCGGHLSPALAVLQVLQHRYPEAQYHYVGRMSAIPSEVGGSLEYRTITEMGIPFYALRSGKISRVGGLSRLISFVLIPFGVLQSLWCVFRVRPDIVIGFGGYVTWSVAIAAWMCRIPIVIHEQTPRMGLANVWVSRFAEKVFLSWQKTEGAPQGRKVVVTGNPVRTVSKEHKKPGIWNFGDLSRPLIYVTGGSLGARVINRHVADILPSLLETYRILHQCGSAEYEQDYRMLGGIRSTYPEEKQKNYTVMTHISPHDVQDILDHASLVVSRSGANTVAEIARAGVPALFIPLSHSAKGEQQENAQILVKIGLALSIDQDTMSSDVLYATINTMMMNLHVYQHAAKEARVLYPSDAAERIVDHISAILRQDMV